MPLPSESNQPPVYPRIELHNLANIAEWQNNIFWEPFVDDVEIHRLYGDGLTGPSAALLRFRKAGKVTLHRHTGYEHIIVLAGSQRDQNSVSQAGTLIINPPDTSHSIMSEAGCIVLAIYEKPVEFVSTAL